MIDGSAPGMKYRVLARTGSQDGVRAVAEISEVFLEHDVVIEHLSMCLSPSGERCMELRVDAVFPGSRLSTVLSRLLTCKSIEVLSAENLESRSTFVLPI